MSQASIASNVTRAACAFIESSRYDALPAEAVKIANQIAANIAARW